MGHSLLSQWGGGRLTIDSNKGWLNWKIVEKMAIDVFLIKKVDK